MSELFSPYTLGPLALSSRVVMAPMTRSRALGGVPNELMQQYYGQRAEAGLIVTEGIAPVPEALGYPRIPGLFSEAQVQGWRAITDTVHTAGGHIVAQLMHVGRVSHPLNLPEGAHSVAPSAVTVSPEQPMFTDAQGPQPMAEPKAMDATDIERAREGFVQAATNARRAGFDGVELHGANGYLLEQFLSPHTNRRDDDYGGSAERRNRLVLQTAHAVAEAIGADRVGIRLSPYNTFNDMAVFDGLHAQYEALAAGLGELGLMYLHVVRNPHAGFADTLGAMAAAFGGPLMLNGGFDREQAQAAVAAKQADLIAFGRPFIANPDLVARMTQGAPLATPDAQSFYSPGPEGYVDYPSAS